MNTNEIVVIYSAIRYSLGRLSYAPSCVMDYVLSKKSELTEENIKIITRDVTEYFEEFPDASYKKEWDDFINKLK